MLMKNTISGISQKSFQAMAQNHQCLNVSRRLYLLPERICRKQERSTTKCMSTSSNDTEKPLSYSASKAAKWKTVDTLAGVRHDEPPSQLYAILGSLTIFMVYFFILREENDIDMRLRKGLGETIDTIDELTVKELERIDQIVDIH